MFIFKILLIFFILNVVFLFQSFMGITVFLFKLHQILYIHTSVMSRYEAGLESWAQKVHEDMDLTSAEWMSKRTGIVLTFEFIMHNRKVIYFQYQTAT